MTDEDLELLERRLADKVIARVRPALFGSYIATAAAVAAALSYAGWDFVSDTKKEISDYGRNAIDNEIKNVSSRLSEISKEIDSSRIRIQSQLDSSEWLSRRSQKIGDDLEGRMRDFSDKTHRLDDLGAQVVTLADRTNAIEDMRKRIEGDLYKLPSAETLASLATELERLGRQVADLAQRANLHEVAADVQMVVSTTGQTKAEMVASLRKPTVWVQFAGAGTREQARTLTKALASRGYIVPEPDREGAAAGKREIRYFDENDRPTAERLATDADDVLDKLGYKAIKLEPKLVKLGRSVTAGIIEIWLELPPLPNATAG